MPHVSPRGPTLLPLKALVIANLSSGRGKASSSAKRIADTLRDRGHEAVELTLSDQDVADFESADVAVVVGGDGTLHAVVDTCVATGTPVYHAPAGTENLFAREFGMVANAASVVDALEGDHRRRIDVAHMGSKAFVVMASIGFDASVIHRLDQTRNGSISHLHYALPIWYAFVRFPLPRLTIEIDGTTLVEGRTGLAVVANSRQYAMRMDPARRARPDDGLLDVVFLPYQTRLGLLRWVILALAGAHLGDEQVAWQRARTVTITSDTDAPLQLDGEAVTCDKDAMRFSIQPKAMDVILPLRAQ